MSKISHISITTTKQELFEIFSFPMALLNKEITAYNNNTNRQTLNITEENVTTKKHRRPTAPQ